MDKLNIGDKYYYLSVPQNCDWMEIKLEGPCIYSGEENLEKYIYSKNLTELNIILPVIKTRIRAKFEELDAAQKMTSEKTETWWVTLDYASHLKTIHSKLGEVDVQNLTPYNHFESKAKAEAMLREICDVFMSFHKPLQ